MGECRGSRCVAIGSVGNSAHLHGDDQGPIRYNSDCSTNAEAAGSGGDALQGAAAQTDRPAETGCGATTAETVGDTASGVETAGTAEDRRGETAGSDRARKTSSVVRNTPHLDPTDTAIAAPKPPEIRTGIFSTGSSAAPTTNLPAQKVQTGGFGDPNGIKGEGKPGKTGNIASLGSFDLPVGPGAGNGTGGANGAKGTVASAGFGNGVAPVGGGGNGGGGSNRGVRQGGFGDVDGSAKPEAPKKRAETGPAQIPVEILFKPKPDYTDDARKAED